MFCFNCVVCFFCCPLFDVLYCTCVVFLLILKCVCLSVFFCVLFFVYYNDVSFVVIVDCAFVCLCLCLSCFFVSMLCVLCLYLTNFQIAEFCI